MEINFDSRLGGQAHRANAKARVEKDLTAAISAQVNADIDRMESRSSVYTRNPFELARDFEAQFPGKYIQNIKVVRDAYGMGLKEAKDVVDIVVGRSIVTGNPNWRSPHLL